MEQSRVSRSPGSPGAGKDTPLPGIQVREQARYVDHQKQSQAGPQEPMVFVPGSAVSRAEQGPQQEEPKPTGQQGAHKIGRREQTQQKQQAGKDHYISFRDPPRAHGSGFYSVSSSTRAKAA